MTIFNGYISLKLVFPQLRQRIFFTCWSIFIKLFLTLVSHYWLLFCGFGWNKHFFLMDIIEDLRVCVRLWKWEINLIIVILPFMTKSQSIIVEHSSFLWSSFSRWSFIIWKVLLLQIFRTRWDSYYWLGLFWIIWVHLDMILLIKCLFNPILLIWVSSCCNYIFFSSSYISLNVLALVFIINNVFPRISIGIITLLSLFLLLLWFHNNSHLVLIGLVASSSWDSRFGKVHDVKSISLTFDSSRTSKVEPLLVSSCVCVDLHKKIIMINICSWPLCLKQIATLKHRIKHKYWLSILLS